MSRRVRIVIRILASVVLAALAGCGGGGGGSSAPRSLPLTVSVAAVNTSFEQRLLPATVDVDAQVTGNPGVSTVYVMITDPAGTFTRVTNLASGGGGAYRATLALADPLPIGAHSGTLTVSICGDSQCAQLLGRTTAAYTVTVTENATLTGTWQPGTIHLYAVQGDTSVSWPATLLLPRATYIYGKMTDTTNQLAPIAPFMFKDSAVALITAAAGLAPGQYTGTLDAVFCDDSACSATKQYSGTTSLPYVITVVPMTNLTTLAPMTGAGDWTTRQGSAAHSGFVPITVDPAQISPRWKWSWKGTNLPDMSFSIVTAGGKAFALTAGTVSQYEPLLYALDETNGAPVWQQPIPDPLSPAAQVGMGGELTPPAIAGGSVLVGRKVSNSQQGEGRYYGFHLGDGTAAFTPAKSPSFPTRYAYFDYLAPNSGPTEILGADNTPRGNSVLVQAIDPNHVATVLQQDATTGTISEAWPACASTLANLFTAASVAVGDNQTTYIVTTQGLLIADTCQGIPSPLQVSSGFGPAVVPGTSDVIAVGNGNLVDFDTAALTVKWSLAGGGSDVFTGAAAVAGGTLYVLNAGRVQLEARSEADGHLLWSWKPTLSDEWALTGNVVVTNNLVFLTTMSRVYAIDIATHQTAWIYPYRGALSISSNGILYVTRGDGLYGFDSIAAINLH